MPQRTREEIEKKLATYDPMFVDAEIIRLLLDIRDLLAKEKEK